MAKPLPGYISTEYTIWCGGVATCLGTWEPEMGISQCPTWFTAAGEASKASAVAAFKRAGWKKDDECGWLCPTCQKAIIKTCSLCQTPHTYAGWCALKYVGEQTTDWGEIQELRNCKCGSTLCLVMEEGTPEDP